MVILIHGITSKKEDMAGLIPGLSGAGFATVAIDLPLHGSRGFDLDGEPGDEVNATTNSPTDFLNLSNLATSRDNVRQSVADNLALRFALTAFAGVPIDAINPTAVYVAGVSLGGIVGQQVVAMGNTPLDAGLDPFYNFGAAALVHAGGGIGPLLIDSGSFGNLVRGSVLAGLNTDIASQFQASWGSNT